MSALAQEPFSEQRRRLPRWLIGDRGIAAPLLFLAPFLVVFSVFLLYPIGYGLYVSFTDWDLMTSPQLRRPRQLPQLARQRPLLEVAAQHHPLRLLERAAGGHHSARSGDPGQRADHGAHLFPERLHGPGHDLGRLGRHHLGLVLQPCLRLDQLLLAKSLGLPTQNWLTPERLVDVGRGRHDRLVDDRLQHDPLPRRPAGNSRPPLRGGQDRRRRRLVILQATSPFPA